MDDNFGGTCCETTPTTKAGRRAGRVRIDEKKEENPWKLLDPHDPGNSSWNKPFKKGKLNVDSVYLYYVYIPIHYLKFI